jgi:hypothetical protein
MLFGETVAVYFDIHTEHTDLVRTLQETHYVSATETNRLMPFGETVAVYFDIHTEHRYTQVTHVMITLHLIVNRKVVNWPDSVFLRYVILHSEGRE